MLQKLIDKLTGIADPARSGGAEKVYFSDCRRIPTKNGIIFQLSDGGSFPSAILDTFSRPGELPLSLSDATVLKQARRRLIVRFPGVFEGSSLVFKVFFLKNPLSRLYYRKYAYREFCNMRRAMERGIPVPRPMAYFEKRRLGMVETTGLIMEDLDGWMNLREYASQPGKDREQASIMAIHPLVELFNTGCHHIDTRDENIIYSENGRDYRIIDWQYAVFVSPRAPWMLEYMAAYYIHKSEVDHRDMLFDSWLKKLWSKADIKEYNYEIFYARVKFLSSRRIPLRSRIHRIAVKGM